MAGTIPDTTLAELLAGLLAGTIYGATTRQLLFSEVAARGSVVTPAQLVYRGVTSDITWTAVPGANPHDPDRLVFSCSAKGTVTI